MSTAGIEMLETDTFRLQCFQTPTGLKFFITAALGTPELDSVLRTIYELYVDYVLKVSDTACMNGSVCVCGCDRDVFMLLARWCVEPIL